MGTKLGSGSGSGSGLGESDLSCSDLLDREEEEHQDRKLQRFDYFWF